MQVLSQSSWFAARRPHNLGHRERADDYWVPEDKDDGIYILSSSRRILYHGVLIGGKVCSEHRQRLTRAGTSCDSRGSTLCIYPCDLRIKRASSGLGQPSSFVEDCKGMMSAMYDRWALRGPNSDPRMKYKYRSMPEGFMIVEQSAGQLMRVTQGRGVAVRFYCPLCTLTTWNVRLHIEQRLVYATRGLVSDACASSIKYKGEKPDDGTMEAQDLSRTK